MKLNKIVYLTQLTARSVGVVSGQSFGSSVVSLACIASMCSLPGGHSLRLAFGSFFYSHPFLLYSSPDKSVRHVPGSIGLGAYG